ncbi:MAG: tetratricopeptide repeat protein [Tepidisphaerales bacterium]
MAEPIPESRSPTDRPDDPLVRCRQALALDPDSPKVLVDLGNLLLVRGQLDQAIACYRRVLVFRPDSPEAHNNLGTALKTQGDVAGAIACFQQALALRPDAAQAHNNLGNALQQMGHLDEAAACYESAIALKPDHADAHNNLGQVRAVQGQLDPAIACYRRALALNPQSAAIHSNLVYSLHFHPGSDRESLYREHLQWNEVHAKPLAALRRPHNSDAAPDRRIRVGYLSPDFAQHPVGRFLLPLLAAHDRDRFHIFCYASQVRDDTFTERLRAHADVWRNVFGLSDDELAELIRVDGIDILVDLAMHMAGNRLLVFARKPAPVQVTYLAYCGATGLDVMDYRLTTADLDPPGPNDAFYSERSIRLPQTYWCYEPGVDTPPVGPLPALARGGVTFGSLNNFCKVTEPTLDAWARLLVAVDGSRLLLHSHPGSHRERVSAFLHARGVSPDRLVFTDFVPIERYFKLYGEIDIALDPFPCGGGTTTCDALWMGVPVVSLVGQTAVARSGLALLSQLGLGELTATTPQQYIRIAADLAGNVPRLREFRTTLRQRMQASPLMDAPRFARDVESAYRAMWHRWCADHSADSRNFKLRGICSITVGDSSSMK